MLSGAGYIRSSTTTEATLVQIFNFKNRVKTRISELRPTILQRAIDRGRWCWVALVVALGLPGCTLGPDYQRPAIPALEASYVGADAANDVDSSGVEVNGTHDAWWEQFRDPKLLELLETAVVNNQNLKAAYARVCESRSRYDLSTIGPWPRLDASSNYSRRNQRNPGFLSGVSSNGGSGFDAFSNGISASWEIDLFGRLNRTIESQDAQWGASVDELRDVLVTLMADVTTNYVELRVLQKRRAIALENVTVQEGSFEIANQRFKAGLVGALDGKQAESVLWTTRALVPQLEEQIQNRINRICLLLGESPHQGMRMWLGDGDIPALPTVTPGIPAALVSQRPDVRAAEKRMHSACAEIGVATADLYPRINLVGDLAYDSLDVAQLFSNQAFYSIGPSIRWNVITLGRTRRNINIREAQHEESVAQFRQTVLEAIEEVENGLVGQNRRSERSDKLVKSANAASDAYDLSLSTYKIGDSNFQRVLEAQRQLLNAQDSSVVAQGDIALSVIQTYRALGAGWRTLQFSSQMQLPETDDGDTAVVEYIPRRARGDDGNRVASVPQTMVTGEYDGTANYNFLPEYSVAPQQADGITSSAASESSASSSGPGQNRMDSVIGFGHVGVQREAQPETVDLPVQGYKPVQPYETADESMGEPAKSASAADGEFDATADPTTHMIEDPILPFSVESSIDSGIGQHTEAATGFSPGSTPRIEFEAPRLTQPVDAEVISAPATDGAFSTGPIRSISLESRNNSVTVLDVLPVIEPVRQASGSEIGVRPFATPGPALPFARILGVGIQGKAVAINPALRSADASVRVPVLSVGIPPGWVSDIVLNPRADTTKLTVNQRRRPTPKQGGRMESTRMKSANKKDTAKAAAKTVDQSAGSNLPQMFPRGHAGPSQ